MVSKFLPPTQIMRTPENRCKAQAETFMITMTTVRLKSTAYLVMQSPVRWIVPYRSVRLLNTSSITTARAQEVKTVIFVKQWISW